MTTIWKWVEFTDWKTKGHTVPSSLVAPLLHDLKERGFNNECKIKTITWTGMDEPGMVHANRPWEEFDLFGLSFHVPCEDLAAFKMRLDRYEMRTFAPRKPGLVPHHYYKLHDFVRCLVLRPAHYERLRTMFRERLVVAEQRATAFWAEHKSPAEVLQIANAKIAGVPVDEMPDYAGPDGHRIDRFLPRERGQA